RGGPRACGRAPSSPRRNGLAHRARRPAARPAQRLRLRRAARSPAGRDRRAARRGRVVTTSDGPLAGLRVVELASEWAAYAGKLLADLGAEVVLVEPRAGH